MKYLNVTLLYFATSLVFNAPDGGAPPGHLHKILMMRMAKVQNGEEIVLKVSTH